MSGSIAARIPSPADLDNYAMKQWEVRLYSSELNFLMFL